MNVEKLENNQSVIHKTDFTRQIQSESILIVLNGTRQYIITLSPFPKDHRMGDFS
jgi:hypothetical protein